MCFAIMSLSMSFNSKSLLALAAATHKEAGNIMYRIHEVPGKAEQYMIYEKWQDQAALDYHMSQKYLLDFLADEDKLFAGEVKGTICTEIDVD
jgi:quinol monooxygenase YgiN